ncbi:MAG: siderophore-interacting protein [Actinomycetospora chiangmaiensis]|nr:siderophore-interacting protein [Actinomycetospora chiangmaiensis]
MTPRLRRVTLACDDAASFAGPAMHARLLVPCPCGPLRGVDGAPAASRYYTVRFVRPEAGEIDIDVVQHAPAGPGSCWGARARPGDRVGLIGPLGRPVPPAGRLVLVGDETALPVIGRLIEEAAPGRRIDALVEVADRDEEQAVVCGAGARLDFLHRSGQGGGLSVIVILHDINMAARFCDDIVALGHRRIVAQGTPDAVMREDVLARIYGLRMGIHRLPGTGDVVGYPL